MPATFNERPHQNEKAETLAYVRALMEQARKDSKHEDLPKLEKIIELIDSKRYGLVWEEHDELVEEEMKSKIPVFVEDESRKIKGNPASEDYHFLLEGDNLHSLHLLEKTHAGKIDVIYIDPPYNTGNKDFIYNDKIVDKNDDYSHSKWLSFMSKRLEIAQNLLSETGVIFISIDDNEQAQLKLLCDEVFREENFIATYKWNKTATAPSLSHKVRNKYEYVICYEKKKNNINYNGGQIDGGDIPLLNRGNSIRDIYFNKENVTFNFEGKLKAGTYDRVVLKDDIVIRNGKSNRNFTLSGEFKWTQDTVDSEVLSGTRFIVKSRKLSVRFLRSVNKTKRPSDIISKEEGLVGTNENAKKELADIILNNKMNYPKPVSLIKYLMQFTEDGRKNNYILDFFAGSGTTGHAVAQLNKEDGGNRKYILCTNNENNICEEVTYKRLANIQEDLPHNLKYFKTEFIEKEDEDLEYALLNNVKTLIELEHAIDLEESDKAVAFTLSEIRELDLSGIRTVYVRQHSHALMGKEDRVRYEGIDLVDVPEYYFAKEMKEAGL
ncbi:site-specific DNA-methyltransferase [Streptococcus mutans]|uniref:site-specific DNA-methyltransferase n=1 Tax=Streptococcus mutans TaxID=1309 RepID=UPI002741C793|nr:site-specific DNA-methyltransferase [Streptococcus mutans]MDP5873354.1 site-specific DNA-methyltransferase [Streptococcus mutans]